MVNSVKAEQKVSVVKKPRSARSRVSWDDRVAQCKKFLEKNNHCKIPTGYKEDKSLGIWVQEVRRNFKKMMQGEKPRRELTSEQVDELNAIEFHWGFTPDPNKFPERDSSWEKNFSELQRYYESVGNFDVPMDDIKFPKLGEWVRVQRYQKYLRDTKRKTFMTKQRIKELDKIGFNWKGDRAIKK